MIFLGNVTCPLSSARNNTNTAVPFVIPLNTREITLLTAGADCVYEVKVDSVNPSAKAAAAATGFPLVAGAALTGDPVPAMGPGAVLVLCVFNSGGGSETVEVWASKFA